MTIRSFLGSLGFGVLFLTSGVSIAAYFIENFGVFVLVCAFLAVSFSVLQMWVCKVSPKGLLRLLFGGY